jgi:hypothetical protein
MCNAFMLIILPLNSYKKKVEKQKEEKEEIDS